MPEIRMVVVNDQGETIHAEKLWNIKNEQAAKDLTHVLAGRVREYGLVKRQQMARRESVDEARDD